MSQEIKKPVTVLKFLNKKGQGIVEFALILAFCVGIGIAAREAGLAEALDAAFAGTCDVAAPKDIQPGVSTGCSGSSTTVTIDEAVKLPEKTDAKYSSMTSDEVKDFYFLNDLKKYFEANPKGNNLDDDIWNAYKGNQSFANDEAEARARRVGLALLGNDLTGDNAVTDAVWKDLKAEKVWAFDQDDKAIYDFLNSNSSMNADELRLRNVYLSELDSDTIATLRSNTNNSRFDNENIYSSYLAIKKKFWPNPVNLTLAPVISDSAFNATSDEMRIFNYVAGVSGQKGLVSYFENFSERIPNVADRLSRDLSVFKIDNEYTASGDNDDLTAAMFSDVNNGITSVDDSFWKQIKQNKGWALDTDDETIKAKLTEFIATIRSENESLTNDAIIAELQERNTQFKKLSSSAITSMINNLEEGNLNEDAYTGYLAIKKQFWPNNVNTDQMVLAQSQGGGGSTDFETRKGEVEIWITNHALVLSGSTGNSLTKGDIVKEGDNYYITLTTNTYDFSSNSLDTQAGWGNDFKKLTRIYRGSDYIYDWYGTTYYQSLNIGDVVITDNGDAFVMLSAGEWIKYPVTEDSNNVIKLNL